MPNFRSGWKKVFEACPMGAKQGRDVYVQSSVYPLFERLKQERQSSYQLMSLYRAITGLNADPQSGFSANSTGTLRNLMLRGISIEYFLDNGDVLISKLRVSGSIGADADLVQDGLYRITNEAGEWVPRKRKYDYMDLAHKWNGAHFAAVPGGFRSRIVAGRQLVSHIKKAYSGEVLDRNVDVPKNHYSMYWSEKKGHGKLEAANSVASLVQQAADAKASVNWLVHGEGAKTFVKSLAILQDAPSLSRFAAGDEETVRHLRNRFSGQKVYFSNPIGVDEKDVKPLCVKVGLTYMGMNINPRDMRSSASRRNVCKEIADKSAKAVLAGGVGAAGLKEVGASGVQKAAEVTAGYIATAVSSPSAASVGLAAAAGYGVFVAAKGSFTKTNSAYKAIKSLMVSTLGPGSEYWYESDDDLLEQLSA